MQPSEASRQLVVTHARDALFERGLRSFFEYRDLGMNKVTDGRVVAHVIRAAQGEEGAGPARRHSDPDQGQ